MSVQSSDLLYIDEVKHVLIDVEKGKQIINAVVFAEPDIDGDWIITNTGCWRGYTAVYRVIDNTLHGIKSVQVPHSFNSDGYYDSQLTMIPYTGSCIVARFNDEKAWSNSDFLECYLDYDEAYELYFENGALKERLLLSSAITEYRDFKNTDIYMNQLQPFDRGKLRDSLSRRDLKYEYDYKSYKWRDNNDSW